jgi:ATP-binding cassette subfamily B protein
MIPLFIVFPIIFGSAGTAALVCIAVMTAFTLFCAVSLSRRKTNTENLKVRAQHLAKTISSGEATVKLFGRVNYERERVTAANTAFSEAGYDFALRAAFSAAAYLLGTAFSITAVVIAAGYGVFSGEISEARAVFITVWIFAAAASAGICGVWAIFYKTREKLPEKPAKRKITYGDIDENIGRNDLSFSGVTFSYGKREIFGGLSFTIKSGESFAVLGQTGAGKTTLKKLINREEEPGGGVIKLGGIEIFRYSRELLEKKLKSLDFTVSNRVSEVMDSNIIILLCGGVCQAGNHNALMIASPLYRKLYEAEFGVNPYKSLDKGDDFDEYLQ